MGSRGQEAGVTGRGGWRPPGPPSYGLAYLAALNPRLRPGLSPACRKSPDVPPAPHPPPALGAAPSPGWQPGSARTSRSQMSASESKVSARVTSYTRMMPWAPR